MVEPCFVKPGAKGNWACGPGADEGVRPYTSMACESINIAADATRATCPEGQQVLRKFHAGYIVLKSAIGMILVVRPPSNREGWDDPGQAPIILTRFLRVF